MLFSLTQGQIKKKTIDRTIYCQKSSTWFSYLQVGIRDRPHFNYIYQNNFEKKLTIMKSTLVFFVSVLAMASATAINFEEPEFKTLLDTTSGNFLALNSTLLIGVVAVVVVLAVAALVASGSFSPAKIVQRYGQEYNQFYDTVDAYSQNRYRRSAANGKADFVLFNSILLYF